MAKDRIEVITSVERRRRWGAEDKARLVAAMNEPGAVVTEIARSAGVDASLLYRWRRQLAGEGERSVFVPVRVAVENCGLRDHDAGGGTSVVAYAVAQAGVDHDRLGRAGSRDDRGRAGCGNPIERHGRVDGARGLAVIAFPSGARVWLATGHTDMRKGFASLALMVQETFKRNPHAGDLWVFRGRRGDLIKLIWHDGDGACLFVRRLERGRFIWPSIADGVVTISAAQLTYLLSGIDWRAPRKTWRPEAAG